MRKLCLLLRRRGAVLAGCYLGFALVWLAFGAYCWGSDAAARAGGQLYTQSLTAEDFTLADLQTQPDGTLVTLSSDPQMHRDITGQIVRSLTVYARFEGAPREMCLYYTTRPGQDFSQERRVFASAGADGSYRYTLPHRRLYALRLDICSPAENENVVITLERIVLNEPTRAAGYFVPSWYQCFCFALYPALTAAALCLLRQGWDEGKARRLSHT